MNATVPPKSKVDRPWLWLLFAALAYAPFIDTDIGMGNVASDLAAIESVAERGTFFINDASFPTIDHLRRPDGKLFSQKSPVFHLVGAAPYWLMTRRGWTLAGETALCLRVLVFLMVILPMGLLLWLIVRHPWVSGHSARWRLAFGGLFGLASLMTPFAVTLNHYVPAAMFLMAAANELHGRRRGFWIGLFIGASLCCDVPPAFLSGCAIFGILAGRDWRRGVALAAGAAPLVLMYAALNMAIIGSPLPANFHEEEMLYYPGSYWGEVRAAAERGEPGYYQSSYPRRMLHVTVGHKGIYWMMPLLAAATWAAGWLALRGRAGGAGAVGWALFPPATAAVAMAWAQDLGGGAYVIRHVLATVPPLYCVLAHPDLWPVGGGRKAAAWGMAVCGGGVAWIGVLNPWSANTLSAWPPLENLGRLALAHPDRLPTRWVGGLIEHTSVTPANGWLDLGLAWMNGAGKAESEEGWRRRMRQAEGALRKAVSADPRVVINYYHLGIVQDMLGRPGEAAATYRALLEREPGNVGGWNNMGIFALKMGDAALARAAWERSLTLAPGGATPLWGLLVLEEMAGRGDAESPQLREALRLHPEDPRLREMAERWGMGR